MASKILSNTSIKSLQPVNLLWSMYKPENAPYHFQAKTGDAVLSWQRKTRSELEKTIGFQDLPKSVYDVLGAKNQVDNDFFEGRHRINGVKAYSFLVKHLMAGK